MGIDFWFGLTGNILSKFFFIAPIELILECKKTGNTEAVPFLFFFFISANSLSWLVYGMVKDIWLVISNNIVGFLFNYVYLLVFFFMVTEYSLSKKLVLCFGSTAFFFLQFAVEYWWFNDPSKVGVTSVCFNICMYFSPAQKIAKVIQEENVEGIPLVSTLILTVNAVIWILFGYFRSDGFMIVPNVIGFFYCVFELGVYFKYKDAQPYDKLTEN